MPVNPDRFSHFSLFLHLALIIVIPFWFSLFRTIELTASCPLLLGMTSVSRGAIGPRRLQPPRRRHFTAENRNGKNLASLSVFYRMRRSSHQIKISRASLSRVLVSLGNASSDNIVDRPFSVATARQVKNQPNFATSPVDKYE